MYAIATIVYGTPITDEISDKISEWEADETNDKWFETNEGQCGFTKLYSGSAAHMTGYCGVKLGEFDETQDFPLSQIKDLAPTPEQRTEVRRRFDALDTELKALARPLDVYIVWSTS